MTVEGKLIEKYETASFGANGFRKREFVIEYAENPQYPEFIKMELIQDKCDLLDSFSIGQDLKVSINLKGRKYDNPEKGTQYFNAIQAWKIEGKAVEAKEAETYHGPETNEPDNRPF